tara:strand:- start:3336 stop:4301 length:966 start_codon:yes stop_codon:yes gene_type:complete
MTPPILVFGSYMHDLSFSMRDFPKPGQTIIGDFKSGPGGKGSNQAVAAARTSVHTAFVGATGEDAFADLAKNFHQEEGVHSKWTRREDLATGTAAIFVNDKGENEIVVALGANNSLSSNDIPEEFLSAADIMVTQLECNLDATEQALKKGKAHGITTLLNPAPMRDDFQASILEWVDILVPNETEFVHMVQLRVPESHASFSEESIPALEETDLHDLCRQFGVPTFIITLGSQGCFVSTQDRYFTVPAITDINVLDTTGAGDAFVGGFASGLIQFGGDLEKAAQYGNLVAGLSVTRFGTAPSMPKESEIQSEMSRRDLLLK